MPILKEVLITPKPNTRYESSDSSDDSSDEGAYPATSNPDEGGGGSW